MNNNTNHNLARRRDAERRQAAKDKFTRLLVSRGVDLAEAQKRANHASRNVARTRARLIAELQR